MKRISLKAGQLLHVETPNGVVNIRTGLTDRFGRSVDSIAVTPDGFSGQPPVRRYGHANTRLVRLRRAARGKVRQ